MFETVDMRQITAFIEYVNFIVNIFNSWFYFTCLDCTTHLVYSVNPREPNIRLGLLRCC